MNQDDIARNALAQAEAWPARNERDRRAKALVIAQIRRWLDRHQANTG